MRVSPYQPHPRRLLEQLCGRCPIRVGGAQVRDAGIATALRQLVVVESTIHVHRVVPPYAMSPSPPTMQRGVILHQEDCTDSCAELRTEAPTVRSPIHGALPARGGLR